MESVFKLKFFIRTAERGAAKERSKERRVAKKVQAAVKRGDTHAAEIYAAQAVHHRHEAKRLLHLASKLDMMCAMVQNTTQMSQISSEMNRILREIQRDVRVEDVVASFDKLETLSDDLQVTNSMFQETMSQEVVHSDEIKEMMEWASDVVANEEADKLNSKLPPFMHARTPTLQHDERANEN
jgi:division protein CdvB (Snf7/Vps24/ESCRT-III family)